MNKTKKMVITATILSSIIGGSAFAIGQTSKKVEDITPHVSEKIKSNQVDNNKIELKSDKNIKTNTKIQKETNQIHKKNKENKKSKEVLDNKKPIINKKVTQTNKTTHAQEQVKQQVKKQVTKKVSKPIPVVKKVTSKSKVCNYEEFNARERARIEALRKQNNYYEKQKKIKKMTTPKKTNLEYLTKEDPKVYSMKNGHLVVNLDELNKRH